MEPQRVLIVGLTSNKGGLETFVLELYRRIDRNRIQFDFLRFSKSRKLAYEDEIVSLGGRVFIAQLFETVSLCTFILCIKVSDIRIIRLSIIRQTIKF